MVSESIKRRLKDQSVEVEERRNKRFLIQRERQRRTWATNTHNLLNRYAGELLSKNPQLEGFNRSRTRIHAGRMERLLKEMNAYQDPRMGLPAY